VTDRVKTLTVEGKSDTLGWVCKPHDCGGNQLFVLFAPVGAQAWAMLVSDDGGNPRWFGKPSDAIKAALAKAGKGT
jgi:Inhibitor of vertebrate lysozyme (Ivy)